MKIVYPGSTHDHLAVDTFVSTPESRVRYADMNVPSVYR